MLHGKTTLTCWPFGQEAKIFFICMVSTTVDTANLGNYSVLEKTVWTVFFNYHKLFSF